MGLLRLSTLALALTSALAAPTAPAAKYCDEASKICYSEYITTNKIAIRIAIPGNATKAAPFDVLFSIVAPKAVGWAAIAWGGQMANNPLTLGWSNGASAVASAKRST